MRWAARQLYIYPIRQSIKYSCLSPLLIFSIYVPLSQRHAWVGPLIDNVHVCDQGVRSIIHPVQVELHERKSRSAFPSNILLHYQVTWMMIRLEKREVTIVILKISALVYVAIPVVVCSTWVHKTFRSYLFFNLHLYIIVMTYIKVSQQQK